MRIIPTQIHGVLDHVTGGTLLSAPRLLGLGDVPASARVLRLAGGAFPASSPWLFGFAREGPGYWLPHVLVGATEMLAAATTRTP
jgi:hypothetical protein